MNDLELMSVQMAEGIQDKLTLKTMGLPETGNIKIECNLTKGASRHLSS